LHLDLVVGVRGQPPSRPSCRRRKSGQGGENKYAHHHDDDGDASLECREWVIFILPNSHVVFALKSGVVLLIAVQGIRVVARLLAAFIGICHSMRTGSCDGRATVPTIVSNGWLELLCA